MRFKLNESPALLLSIHFLYYLPIYRKSSVQRREIDPISLFRKAWAEYWCAKLGPLLSNKVSRDGMFSWDCIEEESVSASVWIQDTCTGKQIKYQDQRRWKIWLRKVVPPRICSLKRIYVLPAFPLAISLLLLVDILQEFMEAEIMLDFTKLIRITLKTGLSRL